MGLIDDRHKVAALTAVSEGAGERNVESTIVDWLPPVIWERLESEGLTTTGAQGTMITSAGLNWLKRVLL